MEPIGSKRKRQEELKVRKKRKEQDIEHLPQAHINQEESEDQQEQSQSQQICYYYTDHYHLRSCHGVVDQKQIDDYLCTAFISIGQLHCQYWGKYKHNEHYYEWQLLKKLPFATSMTKQLSYTTEVKTATTVVKKQTRFIDRFKFLFVHGRIPMYSCVIFRPWLRKPNHPNLGKHVFNRWTGFACKLSDTPAAPLSSNVKMILNYLRDVICNRDQEVYEKVLAWIAHLIQQPERKARVCLGVQCPLGLENKLFWEFIGQVIGMQYFCITGSLKGTLKQFSRALETKLLCVFNNIPKNEHSTAMTNKFRTLVRRKTSIIRGNKIVNEYCRFVVVSREVWLARLQKLDPRFFVFKCGVEYARNYDTTLLSGAMRDRSTIEATFNFFAHLKADFGWL